MMHAHLERLLDSLRAERSVYVPNSGNAGDSFIAHATFQMFKRIGFNYETGRMSGTYPDRVIICGGGGNLVQPYRDMITFIQRNIGRWKKLVILPHTIRSYGDTLCQFDANCYVFCREQQSFDFVTRQASRANVFLSNDLAFNCNFDETRRQMHTCFVPDLFDRVLLIRDSKRLARAAIHTLKSHGRTDVLNVFRGDVEKTAAEIPDINIDLPKAFAADDTSPAASLHATYWMMKFMERFKLIRTNRLHTGIMATLLGKETELYDNAYGKVHDVFSYSIRGKFPKVKWMG